MVDYAVLFDINWDDFEGVDSRPVEIGYLNMSGRMLNLTDTTLTHGKIQYDQTRAFGHDLDPPREGDAAPASVPAIAGPLPGVCSTDIMSDDCLAAIQVPAFIATNNDSALIGPEGSVTYEAEDQSFTITLEWSHPISSAVSSYRSVIEPEGAPVKAHFDGANTGHQQTILPPERRHPPGRGSTGRRSSASSASSAAAWDSSRSSPRNGPTI